MIGMRREGCCQWHGQIAATYVALTVQSADDDAAHGLQLDLVGALLESIAEVLR